MPIAWAAKRCLINTVQSRLYCAERPKNAPSEHCRGMHPPQILDHTLPIVSSIAHVFPLQPRGLL